MNTTPYFSRVDNIPTDWFLSGSCGSDRVYLNELERGDIVMSHSPYYVQNTNGLLVGIDERFTRFDVIRNGEVLTTLTLNWKSDCTSSELTEVGPSLLTNGISELPIPVILMIISVMYLAILRRIRR
jgi:hypothetical protein